MLTDAQWDQLDEIASKTGLGVRMLAKDAYIVADAYHQRISQEMYATHEAAALALINGTYTKATQRVETCVQHGAKKQAAVGAQNTGQGQRNERGQLVMLLQLTANHFCAGLGLINGHVVSCAPILHYMAGWTEAKVRKYAAGKGWTVTEVKATDADQRWAQQTAQRLGYAPGETTITR